MIVQEEVVAVVYNLTDTIKKINKIQLIFKKNFNSLDKPAVVAVPVDIDYNNRTETIVVHKFAVAVAKVHLAIDFDCNFVDCYSFQLNLSL